VNSDKLIALIQAAQDKHGGPLPVVMCTQSGSGEVDKVEIVLDTLTGRDEILLLEKP
jgi:hypothetical protein